MYGVGNVVFIRIPAPVKEVIEGTDARSITNRESGEDGIQMILLKLRCP
jgi:hypothetical protein